MNRILKYFSCCSKKVTSLRVYDSRSYSIDSSISSASSTPFTPPKYDVFLSFNGRDTRKSFTSFLYKALTENGIKTFIDDADIERGRRISHEISQAIKGSKIAVVVVSENYPGSKWCLNELVEILDSQEKGLITVIPIFYKVDPCDLRRQTGKVEVQFKKHERRKSPTKVRSWRKALTQLSDLSGECSESWDNEAKLVEEITRRISSNLFPEIPRSGNNLVGIDAHMRGLYPLLDLNSNEDVKVIGIWGRGSMGRSLLARYVYENISQHFEAHCFLENVRRVSLHSRTSHLQEELISKMRGDDLATKSSHTSLKAIKARLRNKKILLVANDVDKIEQLDALAEEFNWFGPGSKVIITTQDRQLLHSSNVRIVYEVELLRCCEARQLFRQSAFRERDDPAGVEGSAIEAMNLSGMVVGTLRYVAALLLLRGQLREGLRALIDSL